MGEKWRKWSGRIREQQNRRSFIVILALAGLVAGTLVLVGKARVAEEPQETADTVCTQLIYDIPVEARMDISTSTVPDGATLSVLLDHHGVTPAMIEQMRQAAGERFPLRSIRAGNSYTTIGNTDSLINGKIPCLLYFIYDKNERESVIFCFGDSVTFRTFEKEVKVERKKLSGTINSSLWNTVLENGGELSLAAELSDVYQWTIDFYGIQKGDNFTVVYDQEEIDGQPVGTGKIWGARFEHKGKTFYAVRFEHDKIKGYWDEEGASLKKSFLKAPLKYSRISSRFSNSRLHPVLRIRRPHHGVDYAAPKGTPVYAVANGTVIACGWSGGGGNTIKIKHSVNNGMYTTGYLHLSRFAQGMRTGKYVEQGDLIGYVGSTGVSTGPHLDFRVWRKGSPIDPLKMTQEPGEPIADSLKTAYAAVRDSILTELGN